MISLNFDIFFRIFGDLGAGFKINKLLFLCQGETRAVKIYAKYTAKLQAWLTCNFTCLQTSTQFDQETVAKGSLADS